MDNIQYSDYVDLCQSQEEIFGADKYYGRRNKKNRIKPVSERKFNALKKTISNQLSKENYTSREEAQEDLEIKIQTMSPVAFFLLRILINWLIKQLIEYYFSNKENT